MNIAFTEHQLKAYQEIELAGIALSDFPEKPDKERYLGLTSDLRNETVRAGYYIGTTWLQESKYSVSVIPKIDIDYLSMFMECFGQSDDDIQEKLMHIYSIDFDKPCIPQDGVSFELTPFLIIHLLQSIKKILAIGLKKDYIQQEENLRGKVKGKILFAQQFKKNILTQREENNYCRFQAYSEDCIENQILKKALRFAERFLNHHQVACATDLRGIIKKHLAYFRNVTDTDNIRLIKRFRINPLYREYARALKVSKLILQRFSYDINMANENVDWTLPPFWIDMPLLYELYTLTMLRKRFGDSVSYHIATRKDEIDFGKRDEALIMDAKYVPEWEGEVQSEHVGQLTRYARSSGIRKKLLGTEDGLRIFNCLLLYPNENGIASFEKQEILKEEKIESIDYIQFYKLGIQLPSKKICSQEYKL